MAPGTLLIPSNSLVLPNTKVMADSMIETPDNRFLLFGAEWLTLQNYITQGVKLPINIGEFETKYGTFSEKSVITGCLTAMTTVQGLSKTFGNPTIIKNQIGTNPDYLTSAKPPEEIYGHIIWLANQIQNAAGTFSFTLVALLQLLGPGGGTEKQRADNLRMVLTGPGGLASTAEDMKVKTQALITKMIAFDSTFTDANQSIITYSGSSSEIMKKASDLIGQYTTDIQTSQDAANAAYKQWRDYTISAVTTSVGIMILSAGLLWPIAVGLGVGLGVAAAIARSSYNSLIDKVANLESDKQLKVNLVSDLKGLNSNVALVSPAMIKFKKNLETILGVWTDVSMNLAYITNNYSDAQLADLTWVMQSMKILDAQTKWQDISKATQLFTQNSLVSYDFSTKWGSKIAA